MTAELTEPVEVENPTKYRPLDLLAAECMIANPTMEQPPVVHRFTRGMYLREIYMPAGTQHVSKIHKTEHPFVVSKGVVSVSEDGENWTHIEAPYTGITQPGTQRFLVVHEDTIWTTFHVNPDNITDVPTLEDRIVDTPQLPQELLDGVASIQLTNNLPLN